MRNFIPIQIHPFFYSTLALILGIILQANSIINIASISSIISIFLIYFALLFFIYQINMQINIQKIFWVTFAFICLILGSYRYCSINSQYSKTQKVITDQIVNLTGTVIDINKTNHAYFRSKITLNINTIKLKQKNQKIFVNYLANISTPQAQNLKFQSLKLGDKIKINSIHLKPSFTKSLKYFYKENILLNIFLNNIDYKILSNNNGLVNAITSFKKNLANRLTKKMNFSTQQLFNSIFLGLKTNNSSTNLIKDHLNYWGAVHYLARSGLHIVLIILIWSFFLKFIPVHFNIKQFLIIFIITIYSILTWPSISYKRALLSFFLYKACCLNHILIHSTHLITLTCFLTLLYNPYELFFLDFQLSFSLTLALSLFNELNMRIKIINTKTDTKTIEVIK